MYLCGNKNEIMNNAEEKREERWIAFKKELTELVKKHNVEIALDSESRGNYGCDEYFISFDFKNDESKEWEEGSNDYFQKRCNFIE